MNTRHRLTRRKGALAVLMSLLLIPMLALVALCVDYGYLLVVRTDLQRTADAASLAAVQDLIPTPNGYQDLDQVRSRVREYVNANVSGGLTVLDSDIEIKRFDPSTIYSGNISLLDTGVRDTVRVSLRREPARNNAVSLFFARIIGITQASVSVTATAVLQKADALPPGSDILPIAIPQTSWNSYSTGSSWSIYGDGRLEDNYGNVVPGNWGTMDVGPQANSTTELNNQIDNGLSNNDLRTLYTDGRTSSPLQIGGLEQFWTNGDTGYSAGLRHSVEPAHGKIKLIPIVDQVNDGSGGNLDFHVVGWGVARVDDSVWGGNPSRRRVTITKAYMYDGDLRANPDMSDTSNVIEGAFTSPALIE